MFLSLKQEMVLSFGFWSWVVGWCYTKARHPDSWDARCKTRETEEA